MDDWVLIDTCIWIPFFSKQHSAEARVTGPLVESERAALIGPVLTETLQGFHRREQADWIGSRLRMFHFPDISWNDWRSAAHLSRDMAAKGHQLPLTDVVLATIALRLDAFIYTTDPHFDLIPNLKRFTP